MVAASRRGHLDPRAGPDPGRSAAERADLPQVRRRSALPPAVRGARDRSLRCRPRRRRPAPGRIQAHPVPADAGAAAPATDPRIACVQEDRWPQSGHVRDTSSAPIRGLVPTSSNGVGDSFGAGGQRQRSDVVFKCAGVDQEWPVELPEDLCHFQRLDVDRARRLQGDLRARLTRAGCNPTPAGRRRSSTPTATRSSAGSREPKSLLPPPGSVCVRLAVALAALHATGPADGAGWPTVSVPGPPRSSTPIDG